MEEKAGPCQCLPGAPGPGLAFQGCLLTWQEGGGQGQGSARQQTPTPAPAFPRCPHPCEASLLAPGVSQMEVGGRNLAPDQLRPYSVAPWGVWAELPLPAMFPLLIKPTLLMSSYHPFSITPPEPSAPQHLAGDPGAPWLPGQRHEPKEALLGGIPGRSWVLHGLSAEFTQL